MIDLKKLKKEQERDIRENLKIIDIYASWVRKTPNRIWSRQQANILNSVYNAINKNWRATKR